MKIINETNWRTDHLRHFAREIAKRELEPDDRKRVGIIFEYRHDRIYRSDRPSGIVWRSSRKIKIFIPKHAESLINGLRLLGVDKEGLAQVLAHEFAHIATNAGGRAWERTYRSSARYGYRGDYKAYYAFVKDWPLELKPAKAKPTAEDKDAKEIAKTAAAIKRWESKAKLAKTKLAKYRKRLKYYEKKLATAASPAPKGETT